MTSKISFFNIMKEDLRHRLWMVALSLLCNFLALPVFFLICQRSYYRYVSYMEHGEQYFSRLAIFFQRFFTTEAMTTTTIVLVVGAFIVSIAGFRFLYSRRMTDTFHALPISRNQIFLAYYLNGLLIWLIPYLFSLFCALVLSIVTLGNPAYIGALVQAALKSGLVTILLFLIAYHLCLVAVMISGNALNAIISSLILGISVGGIYALCNGLFNTFIPTWLECPIPTAYVTWASPFIALAQLCDLSGTWVFGSDFLLADMWVLVAGSILLMAGNLFLAWKLYLLRPSELCESGIPNRFFQTLLRILAGVLMGLSGASLFVAVLGAENILGWCIFGALLFGFLTYGILNIVFHMDFKAFFNHRLQMVLVVGGTLMLMLGICLDWIGYGTRIPSKDQIVSANIHLPSFDDDTYGLTFDEAGNLLTHDSSFTVTNMAYTDTDAIYALISSLCTNTDENCLDYAQISIQLKNGASFKRTYYIHEKDVELLRPILESDSYREAYYPLACGIHPQPVSLRISDNKLQSTYYISDSSEAIQGIMEAYALDLKEHSKMEELSTGPALATLTVELPFGWEDELTDSNTSRIYYTNTGHYDLDVFHNYTHTIQAIKAINPDYILTMDDLEIDRIELYHQKDVLPEESIYSHFGVEGYPTYDELWQEYQNSIAADEPAAEVIYDSNVSEESYYNAVFKDTAEIKELLPLLYLGENGQRYNSFSDAAYLSSARVYTTSGECYDCYVKCGTIPKKYIDAMIPAEK